MTCHKIQNGNTTTILCTGRSSGPVPKSLRCQYCQRRHTKLCDYNLNEFVEEAPVQTCDRKLCEIHAKHMGPDRDLCPEHSK
jgi:hypothetical protein